MKMPTQTFTWEEMPSSGLMTIMPQVARAVYRAYYEWTKAGRPVTEFSYTYTFTEEDLASFM